MAGIGANVAPKTIIQCGKSIKGLMETVQNYDKVHDLHTLSVPNPALSVDKTKLFNTIKRYQLEIKQKAVVAKLYKHAL